MKFKLVIVAMCAFALDASRLKRSLEEKSMATSQDIEYEYDCCCYRYIYCFEDDENRIVCRQSGVKVLKWNTQDFWPQYQACMKKPSNFCKEYYDDKYLEPDATITKVLARFTGYTGHGSENKGRCEATDGWYPFSWGGGMPNKTFYPRESNGPVGMEYYGSKPRSAAQKIKDDAKKSTRNTILSGKQFPFSCEMPETSGSGKNGKGEWCKIPKALSPYLKEVVLMNQDEKTFFQKFALGFSYNIRLKCNVKLRAKFFDETGDHYSKNCEPGENPDVDYNSDKPDITHVIIELK